MNSSVLCEHCVTINACCSEHIVSQHRLFNHNCASQSIDFHKSSLMTHLCSVTHSSPLLSLYYPLGELGFVCLIFDPGLVDFLWEGSLAALKDETPWKQPFW